MMLSGSMASLMLVFVVVVILIVVVFAWLAIRSRQVNLTNPDPTKKPQWIATNPPAETVVATQADGEGITLYDHDPGERIAAPFAEQIEDIARSLIQADPAIASTKIDFGTAPDGTLEIWVGDKRYGDINALPDERLRAVMQQAVAKFSEGNKSG